MMKNTVQIISIVSLIISIIGFFSFIFKTRGVNAGAFVFPGIIFIVSFVYYKKNFKSK